LDLQFQPDLTEEERIAVASMPNALELYQKAIVEGKQVNLRDVITVGKKAKGMTYDDFVKSLGTVAPAAEVTFKKPERFFSSSEEEQRRLMSTLSSGIGMTPEQLMAYERPAEVPSVPTMGSIDVQKLFVDESIKTPEKQLERLQSQYVQMVRDKDPRAEAVMQEISITQAAINTLTGPQSNWTKKRNELLAKIADPSTSAADRNKAEDELTRGDIADKNVITAETLAKFAKEAGVNAVSRKYGNLLDKNIAITIADGVPSYKYIGTPSDSLRAEIDATYASAVRATASRYVDPITKRLNDSYQTAIDSLLRGIGTAPSTANVQTGTGAPATRVTTPSTSTDTPGVSTPRPATATPMPMGGSAAPVLTTPANAAPARGLASRPVDIAAERREAQAAISRGAPAADVRKRFKERTGQDL
jgi:hypothetical protein